MDLVRRKYLQKLAADSGRNIIAYYSGFLSKPEVPLSEISDEDKNGFMMCVHTIGQQRRKGLDLIMRATYATASAFHTLATG
jgi:hypothetical protein